MNKVSLRPTAVFIVLMVFKVLLPCYLHGVCSGPDSARRA